jgi:putative ABC transport system ATP-binding protein
VNTIEASELTKRYQEGRHQVFAVRSASFEAAPGEVVAIMGPSGSGKTTLLSMLGCILRPTGGRISICGERVDGLTEQQLPPVRRRRIGFIFQNYNLFGALTALENVLVAVKLKGATGPAARDEAARLLEAVGLTDRARYLPRDMSGGQKQRVAIARALAGEPPRILADEPTANLDSKSGFQVLDLLRDAAKTRGRTVVLVTHDHRVDPYIDRTVTIEDGRIL